jgi:hypothetical protein
MGGSGPIFCSDKENAGRELESKRTLKKAKPNPPIPQPQALAVWGVVKGKLILQTGVGMRLFETVSFLVQTATFMQALRLSSAPNK